ncbi:MAG: GNAT family N-acetyltransferase [Firmicutes bacterium]|nr:GNAT family N-acetyltransferase [Bacillota bacterium]
MVQRLAGEWEIAAKTLGVPHPYEDGMAEQWITTHKVAFAEGKIVTLAVTLKPSKILIGSISLGIERGHNVGELGYWIGKPYWNKGYCTEAARALVDFGFEKVGLNRIQARHLVTNPASGRVMQKLGMQCEGVLRQVVLARGHYKDLALCAILREEYNKNSMLPDR